MQRLWFLGFAGLALSIVGVTCPQQGNQNPPEKREASLRGFGSAEELRTYLADQVQIATRATGLFLGMPLAGGATDMTSPSPTAGAVPEAAANGSGDTGSGDTSADPFSTTNVQEAGVDESDVVKNDGQYIYVLDNNTIHIVAANPPEGLTELSKIDIEANGDSLYLAGDKLVALSRRYGYYYGGPILMGASGGVGVGVAEPGQVVSTGPAVPPAVVAPPSAPMPSDAMSPPSVSPPADDGFHTTVTIIDVSNRASPSVAATVRLQGDLASSRLIGNLLYVILTAMPNLPSNPTPAALAAMPLSDWIPDYQLSGADGTSQSGDMAGWQDFFRPANPDGYGMTLVATLDVSAPTSSFKTTGISANAGTVYASTNALYVTDTSYDYTSSTSRTDTAIHKLAFTPEGTAYVASGLVPGRLLNQYSLGEYQDHLRVATTLETFPTVAPTPIGAAPAIATTPQVSNNVYVLGESSDATLATIGKIEGLAPGEQIYSARFIGNRGFLVTYRRVDPLFTLDLSDPANPTVAGLLKVPGYSDHIQLLDDNHLLTIGKATQDAGSFAWIEGVQLSVFDVTDFANPALLYKEVIGGRGTDSEANHNPKAFNYFPAGNALAFPVNVYESAGGGPSFGQHDFTGLYVYRITVADGFQLLGRMASSEGLSPRGCFYGYYGFTRGVFIGNTVYSVTQRSVKAASLDAVGTIVGQAALSSPPVLSEDCFGVAQIILPTGAGLE